MGTHHHDRQARQLLQGEGQMGIERIPGQTKGLLGRQALLLPQDQDFG